jgi:hypothetical protein
MKFQPGPFQMDMRCPLQAQQTGACVLPNCFCTRSGREPPPGLTREQLPQIIVLTFNDPVNGNLLSS